MLIFMNHSVFRLVNRVTGLSCSLAELRDRELLILLFVLEFGIRFEAELWEVDTGVTSGEVMMD